MAGKTFLVRCTNKMQICTFVKLRQEALLREDWQRTVTETSSIPFPTPAIHTVFQFIPSQGLLVCCGAYVVTRGSLSASRALHHQLLDSILHLPLQRFECSPVGQIISRFTKVKGKLMHIFSFITVKLD